MLQRMTCVVLAVLVVGLLVVVSPSTATAQYPVAVTSYYAPQPVVSYYPVRRGLFFPRTVYRPAVTYTAPVPVTTYYAPVAPLVAAPAPVTTYYAPTPVTSYYAPTPVTSYYAPTPVTAYYAPTPVATYYGSVPVTVAPAARCCGN